MNKKQAVTEICCEAADAASWGATCALSYTTCHGQLPLQIDIPRTKPLKLSTN
jgi:hypothetical protein